jgi:hypothetical protein
MLAESTTWRRAVCRLGVSGIGDRACMNSAFLNRTLGWKTHFDQEAPLPHVRHVVHLMVRAIFGTAYGADLEPAMLTVHPYGCASRTRRPRPTSSPVHHSENRSRLRPSRRAVEYRQNIALWKIPNTTKQVRQRQFVRWKVWLVTDEKYAVSMYFWLGKAVPGLLNERSVFEMQACLGGKACPQDHRGARPAPLAEVFCLPL